MLAVGALIMLGSAALSAPAGATWSSPQIVNHRILAATGNARGEQAFSWTTRSGERVKLDGASWRVSFPQVQIRRADGRLTRPQSLTRRHAIVADAGAVGLDGRGAATAVWTQTRATSVRLMASVRPPGGRFARGAQIGRVQSSVDYKHVLAVARDGAAVVLWHAGRRFYAAQRAPGRCATGARRACFGPSQTIATFACAEVDDCVEYPDFALSVAPGGRAFATWHAVTPDRARTAVRLAVARLGHRFSRAVTLSAAGRSATGARIARLHDGGAIVTWVEGDTPSEFRIVALRLGPDGRPRSPVSVLSEATCSGAQIRVNRDEVTIAWACEHDRRPEHRSIAASAGPAGGPLAPGAELGRRDSSSQDALGVDGAGNTVLVYSPDNTATLTRVRPPGGVFGSPLVVPSLTGRQQPRRGGGRLVEAGPRLTLLQEASGPTTQLRDWTP